MSEPPDYTWAMSYDEHESDLRFAPPDGAPWWLYAGIVVALAILLAL